MAASVSTTDEKLKPIDFRCGIYLARLESHTTISPEGWLHNVMTRNKTYGPGDTGGPAPLEIREGQLTPAQIAELARLFVGWESLESAYPGVADGPECVLTYGNKRITGGSELPDQVWKTEQRIRELAESMPLISGP